MNDSPKPGTKPLQTNAKTAPLGDAFISSSGTVHAQGTTRSLKLPAHLQQEALPSRLAEIKNDLAYVQHLVDLFLPSMNTLRYAEALLTLPPEPAVEESPQPEPVVGEGEDETSELPPPRKLTQREMLVASLRLDESQQQLAQRIAKHMKERPNVRQRVQITIHQFTDADSTFQKTQASFKGLTRELPENAWELMDALKIERLKGKAYAICGFYDYFRDDPVLGTVFPAPHRYMPTSTTPLVEPPPAKPNEQEGFAEALVGLMNSLTDAAKESVGVFKALFKDLSGKK